MAEVMMSAFEEIAVPKDHAGIDRMAKTMVSMNKAIEVIFAEDPEEEDLQEEDDMDEERESVRDAVDAWRVILDRKLAGIAERRKAAGMACDGDFDPDQLSKEIDRLAGGASAAAGR